jgi:hypothetical protein
MLLLQQMSAHRLTANHQTSQIDLMVAPLHMHLLLQVSWDFYTASKHGFAALEALAEQLRLRQDLFFSKPASVQCSVKTLLQLPLLPEHNGWSWQQWTAFLQDPLQYKVADLKRAARQLRVPGKSSKAELVVNILQAFGLQQPSSVAPQLLRAVVLERCCAYPWAGCEVVNRVWDTLKSLGSSEVDRKWPGSSEMMFSGNPNSAGQRRAALYMHAGASCKQQLLQLEVKVQQRKEQLRQIQQRCHEAKRYNALMSVGMGCLCVHERTNRYGGSRADSNTACPAFY